MPRRRRRRWRWAISATAAPAWSSARTACADRRRADLPGGTAYQTDAGACADYDSVIGMEKYEPVQRFVTKMSRRRFTPATGPATLCGVFVETNARGLARASNPSASAAG